MEDRSTKMRKDLGNDILEIKDKLSFLAKIDQQMTGIAEQTNILMMKDANMEGKLLKIENIQTDVNNKLSNWSQLTYFFRRQTECLLKKFQILINSLIRMN